MVGIVDKDEWLAMKAEGRTEPKAWCGGHSGPGVVVIDESQAEGRDDYTDVRYHWTVPFSKYTKTFQLWVKYLHIKYGGFGEVRLVFGFDS